MAFAETIAREYRVRTGAKGLSRRVSGTSSVLANATCTGPSQEPQVPPGTKMRDISPLKRLANLQMDRPEGATSRSTAVCDHLEGAL
jgi:hypothetical protein